ncbi:hypothetical protein [Escherichia coli]|uniref:hypothetical protein n=1 Tax=Escherichia coli TaxID=562 RepID=UPI003890D513
MASDKVEAESHVFDDDFELTEDALMNQSDESCGLGEISTIVLDLAFPFIGENHLSALD